MEALKTMREAWHAYRPHVARLLIGTALLTILLFVLGMFAFLPAMGLFVFTDSALVFISLTLFSLFFLIALGMSGVFIGGYMQFVSHSYGIVKKGKASSDERPDIQAMLTFVKDAQPIALLSYACAAALFLIIGIPFFYTGSAMAAVLAIPFMAMFLFFTGFAPYLAIFDGAMPAEAWGRSFELAVKNFWQWLFLLVLLVVITAVLLIIPVVGPVILFILAPWMVLSKIGFYKGALATMEQA